MMSGDGPGGLENGAYTAAVRASDVIYPRGGVWLYFGWYAVAAVVLLWAERAA
jgi:hypothetical protein